MMSYHCPRVFGTHVRRIGKHSPCFSVFRTRMHGWDWWKLVKSILRKKGIGPVEIPHCVKTEQLFMQIKKRQIHLMTFSSKMTFF